MDPDAALVGERFAAIYAVVRRIPRGRVVTYGQVAELAGLPGAARVVGRAMQASAPELGLPWQRVVGKRGPGMAKVSIHDPIGAAAQRALLEAEGVAFTPADGISLREHGWIAAGGTRREPLQAGRGGRGSPGRGRPARAAKADTGKAKATQPGTPSQVRSGKAKASQPGKPRGKSKASQPGKPRSKAKASRPAASRSGKPRL